VEGSVSERFRTTRWSLIAAARDGPSTESRRALAALCEAYWYPLYAYVRLQGYDAEEAKDLTQGYFARLLEKDYLNEVEPASGRFRTFLITTLKHFLVNEAERARALKRGGGVHEISLDAQDAEGRYRYEPVDRLTPDDVFERRWALTVLERALGRLRKEFADAGKEAQFERLKAYLTGVEPRVPYRQVAAELDSTEGAVKAAVRRLRQRFGKQLWEEIAETVARPEEVDDEVRHLLSVIGPWESQKR
jgi:RNA polymerase sigma-70 factor (ECF subfamily)